MPHTLCCVPQCSNRGQHVFPSDEKVRKKWIVAVKRDKWKPSKYSVVCLKHFTPQDYISVTVHGKYFLYISDRHITFAIHMSVLLSSNIL